MIVPSTYEELAGLIEMKINWFCFSQLTGAQIANLSIL